MHWVCESDIDLRKKKHVLFRKGKYFIDKHIQLKKKTYSVEKRICDIVYI